MMLKSKANTEYLIWPWFISISKKYDILHKWLDSFKIAKKYEYVE